MQEHRVPEVQEQNVSPGIYSRLQLYLRQRPVLLVLLTAMSIAFFVMVTGLSRTYRAQRAALGNRWYERGLADLKADRYDAAVTDFRAALMYSRDNYTYQLDLAEALLGMKHVGEASAYLLNLWDRQPEDGLVNLELARIAAQKGKIDQSVRYYHNAIYAAWPSDRGARRRDARLELIDLLLRTNAKAQAQAELIALAENDAEEPTQQRHFGDLFMKVGDYEHALAAYRLSLKSYPRDAAALAGAGYAAFELGRYLQAESYLRAAVAADPSDKESADRLNTTGMVLRLDPFQRQISATERNRIVAEDFAAAGQRLKACPGPSGVPAANRPGPTLNDEWSALRPRVTERELQKDPDLAERAMDVAFRVERDTSTFCGAPTGKDLALLLISKLH
jgi:tetratricopeptide (TPR) repeat protein